MMNSTYIADEAKIYLVKIKNLIRDRGIIFVIRLLLGILFGYYYYRIFKSSRTFTFQKKSYNYFYHLYNVTWMSERAVEVPIIWNIVQKYQEKKILEVGNVLSYYYSVNHDILDKYEKSNVVINQDVVNFRSTKKYDLIVSISTLEHIGWDENIRNNAHEPKKILFAIENLIRCLASEGKLVFTLPIGQNPNMDKILRKKKIKCTRLHCLKRISADNKWIETDWEDIKDSQYDKPFISAKGLVIGTISNNRKNSE
jgi:hypothetical protein